MTTLATGLIPGLYSVQPIKHTVTTIGDESLEVELSTNDRIAGLLDEIAKQRKHSKGISLNYRNPTVCTPNGKELLSKDLVEKLPEGQSYILRFSSKEIAIVTHLMVIRNAPHSGTGYQKGRSMIVGSTVAFNRIGKILDGRPATCRYKEGNTMSDRSPYVYKSPVRTKLCRNLPASTGFHQLPFCITLHDLR